MTGPPSPEEPDQVGQPASVDFFISYNRADRRWAEWIAWHLEAAGLSTSLQAWDFRPGSNFVQAMQDATATAHRTIAVLSPSYLKARFTQPEWQAAFAQDPTGTKGLLLPVRVRDCQPDGLLQSIVYIDLVGLDPDEAKAALLAGANRNRAKPALEPAFPGMSADQRGEAPQFPGSLPQPDASRAGPVMRWWRQRRALRRYRARLIDEHRHFTFLGRAKPLDLDRIYISLKVGEYIPPKDKPDDPAAPVPGDADKVRSRAVEASEALLLDPPRFLVLGEPGSGKTTLLKYLALRLATRDPALGEFARKHMPNRRALILDRIYRFLLGVNLWLPSVYLAAASLLAWLVGVFVSPHPLYGLLALPVVFLTSLFALARRWVAASTATCATVLIFFSITGWMPAWSVAAVALAFLFLLQPYLTAPLLRLLRWARDRSTVFPLPLYLTLNDQARSAGSLEDRLTRLLREVGLSPDFLRRRMATGNCVLLMDALDEVVDGDARKRMAEWMGQITFQSRIPLLVTCRIAAFDGSGLDHRFPGFHRLEVQEFTDRQVELFVGAWFADRASEEQQQRIAGLMNAMGNNSRMRRLASNPLLLSLITLVYERDWHLPERRVDLHETCADVLLQQWDETKGLDSGRCFTRAVKFAALECLAAGFHRQGVRQFVREDLKRGALAEAVGLTADDFDSLVEEVIGRSSLIRRKSKTTYDFAHLTFQEYFTARDFEARRDTDGLLVHLGDPWWREVILFFAGLQQDATRLMHRLHQHDVLLAAAALAEARPVASEEFARTADGILRDLKSRFESDDRRRQQSADALAALPRPDVRDYLVDQSRDERHPERALAAVLALGRSADLRTLDSLWPQRGPVLRLLHHHLADADSESTDRILALLERLDFPWVFVPEGEFRMGEGSSQRDVQVAGFWIGKYPVTNAQFARFAAETSHPPSHWRTAFGPGKDRHPVVNVSWHEAVEFCEWAGVQLPGEKQWEKAARGTDGRIYPWGNRWDPSRCNSGTTGTTAVDEYPKGVSPYGCFDMAGNVDEWCEDSSGSFRVIRGGNWGSAAENCRSASARVRAGAPGLLVGFRVARSSAGPVQSGTGQVSSAAGSEGRNGDRAQRSEADTRFEP